MSFDLNSTDFFRDPFPTYRRLRQESPYYFEAKASTWFISRHADVVALLRHPTLLSSLGASFEPTLHGADPPKHSATRRAVVEHSRHWHRTLETTTADRVADLLSRVAKDDIVDLVEDFAAPLGVVTMASILKVDDQVAETLANYSARVRDLRQPAVYPFRAYVNKCVRDRLTDESGTLLAGLRDGGEFGVQQISDIFSLLVVASIGTIRALIARAVLIALTYPGTVQEIRRGRATLVTFIEEVLRYESPVQFIERTATHDFEVAGGVIRARERVRLLLGSANRDEAVFANPETFDLARDPNKHLAFGAGAHMCLGAQLGRTVALIALELLFERYPDIAFAGTEEDIRPMVHPGIYGLDRLMVRLTP